MKVALMHYHLRPGGVTSVIRDQAAALRGMADCLVLSGEAPAGPQAPRLAAPVRVIPGLGYAEARPAAPDAGETAQAVRRAMLDEWGAPADILHVHNPTLNKNPRLLEVLQEVQEGGVPLFLQVHDFAEDGRPSAYYSSGEYPRDCHYGVLNSRDRDALLSAGLDARGVHLLWNVVRPFGPPGAGGAGPERRRRGKPPRLVYPVRAIRRKNIGEALLLGALLGARLTITLPPRNEADLARYSRWKAFVGERALPALFEAGLDRSLEDVMGEADAAVSTSVSEGFGFAFLEPWTAGIPVVGRRLEHVCADFEKEGISIPALYGSFPVPADCFDARSFSSRWREAISSAFRAFGRALDDVSIQRAWSGMTEGGSVDFGFLDEQAQQEAIGQAQSDSRTRRRMERQALEIVRRALAGPDEALIEANRAAIAARYGPERCADALVGAYRAVRDVPVSHRVERHALLDCFLKPEKFRMVAQREKGT